VRAIRGARPIDDDDDDDDDEGFQIPRVSSSPASNRAGGECEREEQAIA
jgi:hypothetical protein